MQWFGKKMISVVAGVAVTSLTACGGGSHGAAAVPGITKQTAPQQTSALTMRITVPAKTTSPSSARRSPQYISAATQSVAISFVPTSGPTLSFKQNLTPASNPACQAGPSTVCTLTLPVPVGSYTANFATYDGLLDGSGNPTGNVLSANQSFPVTIVQGAANTVDVTFQGIATTLKFLPSATSALHGSGLGPYTLSTCAAGGQAVTVMGVDADANYILGPGAPVPSLTASGGSSVVSIAAPSGTAPNTFTMTTQPGVVVGQSVTLTAAVTPSTAAGSNSGASPVSASIQLTYDGSLCGAITEYPTLTAGANPQGMTAGPDGALWFAEYNTNKIGRVSTSGTVTEYAVPTAGSQPNVIATGPDGALWFTEYTGNNIGRITTAGVITEFPVPTANAQPAEIAAGPDGALWFTEAAGNKIGRVTTAGTLTEYPIPTGGAGSYGITTGPDGAVWFTEFSSSKIGRITTSGTITEYVVPTAGGQPGEIVKGPDGALWFTESTGNKIGRVTTAGSFTEYAVGTQPWGITAGPDGAMWFTEIGTNAIGRITTSGTFTQYPITTASSKPIGIAAGSDGALWFTEANASAVGQLH